MLNNIPPIFKNFYVITSLFFLVWMLFFDSNDVYTMYKLNKKLSDLESDKAYYQDKIKEVENDRHELLSNSYLLEKFARERYLMKKDNEDLYVIIEEE